MQNCNHKKVSSQIVMLKKFKYSLIIGLLYSNLSIAADNALDTALQRDQQR